MAITSAPNSALHRFISLPALGRVFTANSLVAVSEQNGTVRVYFTDGSEHSAWQQNAIVLAGQLDSVLPSPLLKIVTYGAMRKTAFVNPLGIMGWTGTPTALHLRTHSATVQLEGFTVGCMAEALASAGIQVTDLGVPKAA